MRLPAHREATDSVGGGKPVRTASGAGFRPATYSASLLRGPARYRVEPPTPVGGAPPGYDYSLPGRYFVTICTKYRQEIFGVVQDGQIRLNVFGEAVRKCWFDLPNHYYCTLDVFAVMPNHIHGIIVIPELLHPPHTAGGGLNPRLREAETQSGVETMHIYPLTEMIRGFKTFSAAAVNRLKGTRGAPLWQTSFHEHVLRGTSDLEMVREYIRLNPINWYRDSKNSRRGR
ncbi:MAG: transposase [Patescibacteria group bacterium]